MTVWYSISTIYKRCFALRTAGLISLFVALITTLFLAYPALAQPNTNHTINFQGRLLKSNGGIVADGHYNMQFKIYEGGSGTDDDNPDGTLAWTESYVNNGSNQGIQVKNGYFSVNLGSTTPFGTSVNWNNSTIWLSMNIAGSHASCTAFGTSPCTSDGEMLPMKRLTATPYSLNSGAVGGKSVDQLVQLGQGVQGDASSNSSIAINKTGAGSLIQLQNDGTDIFTVGNAGDILLGNNSNKLISIAGADTDTAGNSLSVIAGNGGGGTGSAGGDLILQAGAGGGDDGTGGNVSIDAGEHSGTGDGGHISIGSEYASSISIGGSAAGLSQDINIGTSNTAGGSSNVVIGSGGSADGGSTTIQARNEVSIDTNGETRATFADDSNTLTFGNSSSKDFILKATDSESSEVAGGSLNLQGGNATSGDANGGNIVLRGGDGSGTGSDGQVVIGSTSFSTAIDDANCYTNGLPVDSSCTVTTDSVNTASAVLIGFSEPDLTATLPDPTIKVAGKIMYIMAADNSEPFTLSVNGGGANNEIPMDPNTTTMVMWNGSKWSVSNSAKSDQAEIQGFKFQEPETEETETVNSTAPLSFDQSPQQGGDDTVTELGTMYYDSKLGKLQCYETKGWGDCTTSPDAFVTLSPEYSNAVMNGSDIGTISSDLCSDSLGINDGSDGQPTICAENETYNFYKWTSRELEDQTRSIYVTYQLPSSFKEFVPNSVSLLGRTDSDDSKVSYQIYRDSSDSGLTSCGTEITVSEGGKTSWQKSNASDDEDPANCDFKAGDSVLFRINMSASQDASAYVSNLSFVFSNNQTSLSN